jgi:hypothetical protein
VSELRTVISPRRSELSHEVGRLRREAAERYTEVDLLVAAMREHIDDLRRERDRLIVELERSRATLRRYESPWLERGQKPPRS